MDIFVGNISYEAAEDDLQKLFEQYGTVEKVRIINDRDTGRSKGFGFVTMSDSNAAEEAMRNLDGADLCGRAIRVNQAERKSDGGGGGGGGYGGGGDRRGGGRGGDRRGGGGGRGRY
ncbi:MAG: RNA-binding protein [Akkermansiaceae bacterium]|nr:RNA-binding protein [Akkermansiaceae bacterium]NNM30099.1 RNA-binding protein [Akkermansiaceae bacterium]